MRQYPVPFQSEGEEPIIGGALTLRQVGYIAVGFALGAGLAAVLPGPWWARALAAAPGTALGLACAFITVKGERFDLWAWRWLRWRRQARVWCWTGREEKAFEKAEVEGE